LAILWGCLPDQPRGYHHTPTTGVVYALREALALLVEEGLENVWRRHSECTALLHEGIKKLGLELLVNEPAHRLPVVTAIKVPPGVDWKAVSDYAMSRYKVEIAGSLGANTGSIWRIGIMGQNARPETVQFVLKAFGEGLQHVRQQSAPPKL
jgi:alanine-glyoxylate transaminase/serine-glyoxylate transaminase/serine-pyruvate transaminase